MLKEQNYEELVESFVESKQSFYIETLNVANILLEAKENLEKEEYQKWLSDSRVYLQETQINKLVKIARYCREDSSLKDYLTKEGIQNAFILTKIKDSSLRKLLIEELMKNKFNLIQVNALVYMITAKQYTIEKAISEVKSVSTLDSKIEVEDVTAGEETETESLEMSEEATNRLLEPVETDKEDGYIDFDRHTIVYDEWELPLPPAYSIFTDKNIINHVQNVACKYACEKLGFENKLLV